MKRFYTHYFIYFLGFCMILTFFSACGSSSKRSREAASSETGSISFNLNWNSSSIRALSPSGNACTDYGIENIEAKVYKDPNTVVASGSCFCDDSQNIIDNVPAGSGYSVIIEGLISGESHWKREITDVRVFAGETTDLGSVDINYVGDDITPPSVEPITPTSLATEVPIDLNIIIRFDENIVEASLNPNTFILESSENKISGTITYDPDPNSKIAIFDPDIELSFYTTYTVTIKKEVQDKNSHELPADFSWSFTTAMDSLIWDEGKWDEAKWVD